MAADRAQHVATTIRPALARGRWVVSDRFLPSSLVYQGVVRDLGVDVVAELNRLGVGEVVPDLVLLLDVADEVAEARRGSGTDRLEAEGGAFHARVRAAYRDLARRGAGSWSTATPARRRGRMRSATRSSRSWQDDR